MAGIPLIKRKRQMARTAKTEINADRKNIACITISLKFEERGRWQGLLKRKLMQTERILPALLFH